MVAGQQWIWTPAELVSMATWHPSKVVIFVYSTDKQSCTPHFSPDKQPPAPSQISLKGYGRFVFMLCLLVQILFHISWCYFSIIGRYCCVSYVLLSYVTIQKPNFGFSTSRILFLNPPQINPSKILVWEVWNK